MTQAIEEAVIERIAERHQKRTGNINQIGSVVKILEELMPDMKEEFATLYSQGRDAGVEECIDFCTKYAEDDEDKRGQLHNAVASTARRIATELLKLKGN